MIGLGARLIPEARSLFEVERVVPAQPTPVRQRALARANASLAVIPVAAVSLEIEPAGGRRFSRLAVGLAAFLAATFGAGAYGLAEWLAHHRHAAPVTAISTSSRPTAGPRISRPRSTVAAPLAAPPAPPAPQPPPLAPTSFRGAAPNELALLTQARDSVMHGDFAGALPLLARHARLFPNGALAEERDALWVRVLVGLDRHPDAQRAARFFAHRHPKSPLGPVVAEITQTP